MMTWIWVNIGSGNGLMLKAPSHYLSKLNFAIAISQEWEDWLTWIDRDASHRMSDPLYDLELWLWPWISKVKLRKIPIPGMGWPINMEQKGWELIGSRTLRFYLRNGRADWHGPLVRYVKLRVAHALGIFSPPLWVNVPDMHCGTHVPWCMLGSLTSGFLGSRWHGKRSRYSRHMCNQQFYISGKRPTEQKGCELIGCWTHHVTLSYDIDIGTFNVIFWNNWVLVIMGWSIDMEWKGYESLGFWTH